MITPEEIDRQCDALCELLKRKNADYGDSFSERPYLLPKTSPQTAALVRLSDKFHRLRTLWNSDRGDRGERTRTEESLEDTIRDVAGYCVLLLAYANAPISTSEKPIMEAPE